EYARALAPDARIGFRFENCLVSGRLQAALQRLTELREAFVPGDCIVLDDEVTGTVLPVPLQRAMQWLRGAGLPAVVGRLEVAGVAWAGGGGRRAGGVWWQCAGGSGQHGNSAAHPLCRADH